MRPPADMPSITFENTFAKTSTMQIYDLIGYLHDFIPLPV